jgi:predicted regulator of Ras-like GTPase activity (Roadblock/LC7/MglB family)
MPFRRILHDLLSAVDGAIGAVFLDWEGETVEWAADEHPPDDLRIVGAYQGIFLGQLEKLCRSLEVGRPDRFKVEFERSAILSRVLEDGYYLVLIVGPAAREGLAWHQLDRCRAQLMEEM